MDSTGSEGALLWAFLYYTTNPVHCQHCNATILRGLEGLQGKKAWSQTWPGSCLCPLLDPLTIPPPGAKCDRSDRSPLVLRRVVSIVSRSKPGSDQKTLKTVDIIGFAGFMTRRFLSALKDRGNNSVTIGNLWKGGKKWKMN